MWLKKIFYGTEDGLPQKKINERDIKKIEDYLEKHKDIIEVVKHYQMKSPFTILEEAGYQFELVADIHESLKMNNNIFTIYDYSRSDTKNFVCMCAILYILGEDIDNFVSSPEEVRLSYYKKYIDYLYDCFVPMDKLLDLVQKNMTERNCYTTIDKYCSVFYHLSRHLVMLRVSSSPLYEYAHHSDRYN